MKKLIVCILVVVLGIVTASAEGFTRDSVEISLKEYQQLVLNHGHQISDDLDLIGLDKSQGLVELLATDTGKQILSAEQVSWKLLKKHDDLRDNRDIDPQYYNYDEVTAALANMQTAYPSIAQRIDLGTTYENRKVWALKISDNVTVQEEEPEVLFIGLHEAREIMSTEIAMDIADYLTSNYGSDPDVTNWVNTWQIWIVPMLNPDGSAYCWSTDQYWIKNRRDLGNDVYGVALGHNYPVDWGSCFGSSSDPNSNGYRGENPESEIETQAITTLAADHKFMAVVSYHSFDEFVLYPYGCTGEVAPEDGILSSFASSVGNEIQREDSGYGYTVGNWWEILYANDGNETDYFYAGQGSMAIAIEVNAESYYPSYSIRNTTVNRNRAGWQKVLDLYETGRIVQGTITDACTGDPVPANFYFEEYPLTPKESLRQNNPETGFFTAVGRSGVLHLVVEAEGYLTQRVPVTFATGPVTRNVSMIPTNQAGLAIWAMVVEDQAGDDDGQLDPGETAYMNVAIWAPGLPVSGITGVMTTNDPYITVNDANAAWDDLPAGGGAYCSANRFRITAAPTTPEFHEAELTITFSCNENICDPDDVGSVSVFSINYMCPWYEEAFDINPGWDISSYPTQGSPAGPYGDWAFGEPIIGPDGAYTGQNVYGTNLGGNYDNQWTLCLTSPIIDCTGVTEVALKFAQFYEIESNYDHARVRIRNDGGSWDTILDVDGSSGGWIWQELDISNWADNEPEVEIRFDVRADNSINQSGHYIDDFWLCGLASGAGPNDPTPTLPPTSTPTPVTTPTPTPTPTGNCVNHGDVNNDQEVTAGDAQTSFLIALGSYSPSQFEFCAADCNGDEEVTAGDAQTIFLMALGSASCVDPLPVALRSTAYARTIVQEMTNVTVSETRKVDDVIEVTVDVYAEQVIDSFLVELSYDASKLELIDAVPGKLDPDWLEFDFFSPVPGAVRVGGYSSGLDTRFVIPEGAEGSLIKLMFAPLQPDRLSNQKDLVTVNGVYDDLR